MLAREVRERLRGRVDEQTLFVLEALAESLNAQKDEIMGLAQLLDQMTDLIMQMGVVTEKVKNAVDEVTKKRLGPNEDSGPTRIGVNKP